MTKVSECSGVSLGCRWVVGPEMGAGTMVRMLLQKFRDNRTESVEVRMGIRNFLISGSQF